MLRVMLRGAGLTPVTLGSGETVLFGRSPHASLPDDPDAALRHQAVSLPDCAPHVSRLMGELVVSDEVVRLRWRGTTEAQLSSLFEAPGGARRVTLTAGMTALLDEGENHLLILRGRPAGPGQYADVQLSVQVDVLSDEPDRLEPRADESFDDDPDGTVTGPAPSLEPRSREWYVALALAEPWLTGADDYPRPPSNREIYERVLGWHGYAWNLSAPQRVDDALRAVSRLAFGAHDDPFASPSAAGRTQNVRFAIGRRAAEVRLVTSEDIDRVEREARAREQRSGGPLG